MSCLGRTIGGMFRAVSHWPSEGDIRTAISTFERLQRFSSRGILGGLIRVAETSVSGCAIGGSLRWIRANGVGQGLCGSIAGVG